MQNSENYAKCPYISMRQREKEMKGNYVILFNKDRKEANNEKQKIWDAFCSADFNLIVI